jgi:hypothetical protein
MMPFKHGHYIDSGLPQEERERRVKELEELERQYSSVDDLPDVSEDQDSDEYSEAKPRSGSQSGEK